MQTENAHYSQDVAKAPFFLSPGISSFKRSKWFSILQALLLSQKALIFRQHI